MRLSVIVPVYNMEADGKLAYCLDSLLGQSLADGEYEIIAVDDASTDGSYGILKEYEARFAGRVKAVKSPQNRRQGGARNLGLRAASGEWIGFVDSDDWVAPDMYEKLLRKAQETGADVVGCDYHITYEHSMKIGRVVENNTEEQTGELDHAKYASLVLASGSMVVKIYRRRVITENGLCFPEGVFYEDNCAAPVWMLCFRHFERVAEPLYYYYQHGLSTVHHISVEKCEDRLVTGRMLVEEFKKRGFYEEYKRELEFRFTELYYINTLFTYVVGVRPVRLSYLHKMAAGMLEHFPQFQENEYYVNRTDAEQKRLIRYQLRSSLFFLAYYRALHGYRRLRESVKRSSQAPYRQD